MWARRPFKWSAPVAFRALPSSSHWLVEGVWAVRGGADLGGLSFYSCPYLLLSTQAGDWGQN